MKRGRPITPKEVPAFTKRDIPDFVFDAVNRLLLSKCLCNNKPTIGISEVKTAIQIELDKECSFEPWWFNFEDDYRKVGWSVYYDDDSSEGYWIFSKSN